MDQFNGDVARRLQVAIELVNGASRDDATPERRNEWFEANAYQAPTTVREWKAIATMAREHRPLLDALMDDPDTAAELLNQRLRRLGVMPQLTQRAGGYQLHFHTLTAGFAEGWDAGITAALAIALSTGEASRLGRCTAPPCDRLFLDRGRNNQRRFCSLQCQNRAKSAAYRARGASQTAPEN